MGRTGTFIGLFKLIKDYQNKVKKGKELNKVIYIYFQVPELDPFETVLTMRRQRMMMIHYMIKCLADYVVGETSAYV